MRLVHLRPRHRPDAMALGLVVVREACRVLVVREPRHRLCLVDCVCQARLVLRFQIRGLVDTLGRSDQLRALRLTVARLARQDFDRWLLGQLLLDHVEVLLGPLVLLRAQVLHAVLLEQVVGVLVLRSGRPRHVSMHGRSSVNLIVEVVVILRLRSLYTVVGRLLDPLAAGSSLHPRWLLV